MPADEPITIKGGSVTIEYNEGDFEAEPDGKYCCKKKTIRRIEITGGGVSLNEKVDGNDCVIKVYYS
ncbi:MAG: hypothetical protein H0W76_19090 [Pyrinomonadaceae bacterium]|nr:hypothetical protein [Pyrinomonadaceae bacterium]